MDVLNQRYNLIDRLVTTGVTPSPAPAASSILASIDTSSSTIIPAAFTASSQPIPSNNISAHSSSGGNLLLSGSVKHTALWTLCVSDTQKTLALLRRNDTLHLKGLLKTSGGTKRNEKKESRIFSSLSLFLFLLSPFFFSTDLPFLCLLSPISLSIFLYPLPLSFAYDLLRWAASTPQKKIFSWLSFSCASLSHTDSVSFLHLLFLCHANLNRFTSRRKCIWLSNLLSFESPRAADVSASKCIGLANTSTKKSSEKLRSFFSESSTAITVFFFPS
jgi:hypothetical protein